MFSTGKCVEVCQHGSPHSLGQHGVTSTIQVAGCATDHLINMCYHLMFFHVVAKRYLSISLKQKSNGWFVFTSLSVYMQGVRDDAQQTHHWGYIGSRPLMNWRWLSEKLLNNTQPSEVLPTKNITAWLDEWINNMTYLKTHWLTLWPVYNLADALSDCVPYLITDLLNEWNTDSLTKLNKWLIEWIKTLYQTELRVKARHNIMNQHYQYPHFQVGATTFHRWRSQTVPVWHKHYQRVAKQSKLISTTQEGKNDCGKPEKQEVSFRNEPEQLKHRWDPPPKKVRKITSPFIQDWHSYTYIMWNKAAIKIKFNIVS